MKRRILLMAGALLLSAGTVRAATYDFYVFTYCPSTSPLCGFASQQAYKAYIKAAVQNMNVEWEPVNISFRPVVFNIQQDDYYGVTQGCDSDVPDNIKDRRQEWRANVASVFPNAISVMITPGANWCCSHIPGTPYGNPGNDVFPNLFGMFCSTSWDSFTLGAILAHEAGHYFCLVHTQTFQDPATHPTTDHDNDDCCGINDTPPDPARQEGFDPNGPGGDLDINGNPVNGHEWCTNQPLPGLTDDGSPHATLCQPTCFLYSNNVQTTTGYTPASNAAMSYYMAGCNGPYVVNGQRTEAFTPDSINQVRNVCIPQVPERANLPDVCANYGGDTDHDGICQSEDNCPNVKNTSQADTDGDGDADACDLCPDDPVATGDLDGDGIGDYCDPDKDGDNCDDDTVDLDPNNGQVHVGFAFNSSCGFGIEPIYASAEIDPDNDGFKSCEDVDDDNDGICDGSAAEGPGAPGAPPDGCLAGPDPCPESAGFACFAIQGSPTPCPPPWLACLGTGCVEFFMKIVSVINPAEQVVLDGYFRISNRSLYNAPLAGLTLGETANVVAGNLAAGQLGSPVAGGTTSAGVPSPTQTEGSVRLEIWSRRTNSRVAIVAEYDASQVTLGDLSRGRLIRITPTVDATGAPQIDIGAVYGGHAPPDDTMPPLDADGDGRPDIADNCLRAANFLQNDADGDGFGNACDADINGDLMVTDVDVQAVRDCLGANLAYEIPISEPQADVDGEAGDPVDPRLLDLKMRCGAMDLDDDADVDDVDVRIAENSIGRVPGPSAKATPDTGCKPADCDDGLACTHDYCDRLTGQCRHVAGSCDDGDACSTDRCDPDTGQCLYAPLACDDGNICTRDSCDQAAGGCLFVPEPDGLSCDDGDLCTRGEVCRSGQCGGGTPALCDDGDPCTLDACDPATGLCVSATGACDDGNPCTRDSCDPKSGACGHVTEPNGTSCSDGSLCTDGDLCADGFCSGVARDCADADLCTVDTCDPATGQCLHAPLACDDGNACTVDACDPASGRCLNMPLVPGEVGSLGLSDRTTVKWEMSPDASHWNTYRGSIPPAMLGSRVAGGASAYDHVCFESADFAGDGATKTTAPFVPPPGSAFYYLATGENQCAEGILGRDTAGAIIPNTMPCPTPP